jgi:predicted dehydrogenase
MKVLLVGAGAMAQAYGRVLNALGVAWQCVGRGAASAGAFEQSCGVRPIEGGLANFIAQRPLPAKTHAIVALPPTELTKAACALVSAGAHRILVEKPGGVDVAEIEGAASVVGRTDTEVYVAYNRRFYAAVAAARAMIAEDGGATSFHFEFTERDSAARLARYTREVLQNWILANSSHVLDLAFHLGGQPQAAWGMTAGELSWHPTGAVFAGHGRTEAGALFSWLADWSSAGRWGVDVRTRCRRLLLQPLEELRMQQKDGFDVPQVPIDDRLDREFKPGIYRQVEAFLSADPSGQGLPTLGEQAVQARRWASAIWGAGLKPALEKVS